MQSSTGGARLVIVSLVILIVGLTVGIQLGGALSSRTIERLSTTTLYVNTSSLVQVSPDLVGFCFSPGGKCADLVINWIDRANSTVHVLIYSFTLDAVAAAIVAAKNRGVDVKIVMDRSNANERGSEYSNLKNAGVDIRLDTNSALMHDKVTIIDGGILLTGSMNWSNAGVNENNDNVIVLNSQVWASAYESQFQQIYSQGTP